MPVNTTNVFVSRSGTGWTVDVTNCNLDSDLSVYDFIVIQGGVLVGTNNYAKTSRTVLTYTGVTLPTTAIEVRRKTPVDVISPITYASRFSSALWNSELDRNARWKAETELNGSGVTGVGIPIPSNSPYDSAWAGDTVYPPTRQAVYNKIQTMPTLTSAPFTISPTVPDLTIESTSNVPNTRYITTNYAPLNSPALTGSPTAPTKAFGDSSVSLATDAFVQTAVTPYRVSSTVAARSAVTVGTGYVDVVTIAVTLPRANPVRCTFSAYTAANWVGVSSTSVITGSWVYKVNGIIVSEQGAVNGQASSPIYTPTAEAHLLPFSLTTTPFNVVLQTRYNVASNLTWGAFTFVVEFFWY